MDKIDIELLTNKKHVKSIAEWARTKGSPVVAEHIEESAKHIQQLEAEKARLEEALKDMLSGWRYIRQTHGDLYGVGWDRAQNKAERALELLKEKE